jgi:oxaloacetate decarboxylase gamma subunit
MFGQSAVMAMAGMGTVFSFLVIMIIAISLVGKLSRVLGWGDKDVVPSGSNSVPGQGNNAEVTAAIGAAVNEYKKNN